MYLGTGTVHDLGVRRLQPAPPAGWQWILLFRGTTMIEDTVTIDKRKRKVEEKVMNSGVQRMPRFIFTPTHYLPVKL
jgi:hypothetical protein